VINSTRDAAQPSLSPRSIAHCLYQARGEGRGEGLYPPASSIREPCREQFKFRCGWNHRSPLTPSLSARWRRERASSCETCRDVQRPDLSAKFLRIYVRIWPWGLDFPCGRFGALAVRRGSSSGGSDHDLTCFSGKVRDAEPVRRRQLRDASPHCLVAGARFRAGRLVRGLVDAPRDS
jgi:hypothetical protein